MADIPDVVKKLNESAKEYGMGVGQDRNGNIRIDFPAELFVFIGRKEVYDKLKGDNELSLENCILELVNEKFENLQLWI